MHRRVADRTLCRPELVNPGLDCDEVSECVEVALGRVARHERRTFERRDPPRRDAELTCHFVLGQPSLHAGDAKTKAGDSFGMPCGTHRTRRYWLGLLSDAHDEELREDLRRVQADIEIRAPNGTIVPSCRGGSGS